MPMQPLQLEPGINTQAPLVLNSQGWAASNLVRWLNGYLQKLGGWLQLTSQIFLGVCRGLLGWADLTGTSYIAIGTTQRLQVYTGGNISDITPIIQTSNLPTASTIATTASSRSVIITDPNYAPIVGNWIQIANMVSIGGLVLQGFYLVLAVGAGGTYTINASSAATSTSTTAAVLNFSVTADSNTAGVTLSGYTFTNGQNILVFVTTTVGGSLIAGNYTLAVSGGNATFSTVGQATSDATGYENGGQIQIQYLLTSAVAETLQGYGAGLFGAGLYGAPNGPGSNTVPLRQWSMDQWGEDLIAVLWNGAMLVWQPPVSYNNPATLLTGAPTTNTGAFVAMPQQQIIAFGTTDPETGEQDPLQVSWCDVANYNVWTASTSNQAGSFQIPTGNRIIGGAQAPLLGMIWTDIDMYIMQYIGYPYVYGFTKVGWGCGLYAMRAVGRLGPFVYWMGASQFFMFDGSMVHSLTCTVWDFIFNTTIGPGIDRDYPNSVFAAPNSYFNEIAWYFPTVGSNGVCTSYVKYNVASNLWDYGTLGRSAWIDQSAFGAPVGADYNYLLQQHEVAADANGVAMDSSASTGFLEIAPGTEYMFVERVLPELLGSDPDNSGFNFEFAFQDYQQGAGTPRTYSFPTKLSTRYLVVRGRGRYMQMTVSSSGLGSFWRLGLVHMLIAPTGRR